MNNDNLSRFLGGSPGRVALRLVFLSFVVGLILSALSIHPLDILRGIQRFVMRIYDLGFSAIEQLFSYFLLGAMIVIPIWFVLRLINSGRTR